MRKPILLFVALLGLLTLPGSVLGQGGDPSTGGTAEIRGRVLGRQGLSLMSPNLWRGTASECLAEIP